MAGVTQQSPLFAKVMGKLAGAVNAAKGAVPILPDVGLPAGIENATAQIRKLYFNEYKEGANKGQKFLRTEGRCVDPPEFAGGMTSIQIPLCDTPNATKNKTFSDNWAVFRSRIVSLLGGDDVAINTFDSLGNGLDLSTPQGCAQYDAKLVGLLNAILQRKPPVHVRFRTWKGKKATTGQYANQEPRVQHTWGDTCEWNAVVDPGAGVTHSPEPSTNGHSEQQPDNSPTGAADGLPVGGGDEEPQQEEGVDLAALLERASGGDEDAQRQMQQVAADNGVSEKDSAATQTWEELAGLIESAIQGGDEEPEPEPPAVKTWKKGDMCKYTVVDAKTGKPILDKFKKQKKPVVCDLTAVDVKTGTATLLNMDDRKTVYKGVPFAALEDAT